MPTFTGNPAALAEARRILWPDGDEPFEMPVMQVFRVAQALADQWDTGAEASYEWQIGATGKPDNPWRDQ